MTNVALFDTLAFLNGLESGGVEHEKAIKITEAANLALTQAFDAHQFATKIDLLKTKQDLQYFFVKVVTGAFSIFATYETFLQWRWPH